MGLRRKIKKFLYNLKYSKNKFIIDLNKKKVLITGSNSGIGLSLAKKILEQDNQVFATYREKSDKLDEIKNENLFKIKCDQSKTEDYINLENKLKNVNIDIIINCAGIFGPSFKDQEIENIALEKFRDAIMVNSLSIIKISQIVLKNKKPEIILNLSSDAGSISLNKYGDAYIYRTSKSALNSITKNMSVDLKKKYGTTVFAIDPGNVQSGMNSKGYMESDKCANMILDIISNNVEKFNGKFINLSKNELSW